MEEAARQIVGGLFGIGIPALLFLGAMFHAYRRDRRQK
jgi:cbb3-type cytochrome oxidase subunit 3